MQLKEITFSVPKFDGFLSYYFTTIILSSIQTLINGRYRKLEQKGIAPRGFMFYMYHNTNCLSILLLSNEPQTVLKFSTPCCLFSRLFLIMLLYSARKKFHTVPLKYRSECGVRELTSAMGSSIQSHVFRDCWTGTSGTKIVVLQHDHWHGT